MNKTKRDKNRENHYKLERKFRKFIPVCVNCGEKGSHFVPSCFGENSYFYCDEKVKKNGN